MKTLLKILGCLLFVFIVFAMAFYINNRYRNDDGDTMRFGEELSPMEAEAGHALSEEEYVKKIREYDVALFKYYNGINHSYMRIASKEYRKKYPDSACANVWHAYVDFYKNNHIDDSVMMILPYMQEMEDTPAIPWVLFWIFESCYINSHNNHNHYGGDSWWDVPDNSICANRKEAYDRICTYWARRVPEAGFYPNGKKSKRIKEWGDKEFDDTECECVWTSFVANAIDNSLKYKELSKRMTPSKEQWEQSVLSLQNELKKAKGKRRKKLDKDLKGMLERGNPEEREERNRMRNLKMRLDSLAMKKKNDRFQIEWMFFNLERDDAPMQSQIPNYKKLVKSVGRKEADLMDAYYIAYVSGRAREVLSRIETMDLRDERVLWLKHDCQCALLRPLEECIPTLDAILKRNPKDKRAQDLKWSYLGEQQNGK